MYLFFTKKGSRLESIPDQNIFPEVEAQAMFLRCLAWLVGLFFFVSRIMKA